MRRDHSGEGWPLAKHNIVGKLPTIAGWQPALPGTESPIAIHSLLKLGAAVDCGVNGLEVFRAGVLRWEAGDRWSRLARC